MKQPVYQWLLSCVLKRLHLNSKHLSVVDPLSDVQTDFIRTKGISNRWCWITGAISYPTAILIRLRYAFDGGMVKPSPWRQPSQSYLTQYGCLAIWLLGNTSANISRLRYRKILQAFSPDIQDLADDDIFKAAAPDQFGQGLEAKIKEWVESVRVLSAVKP